MSQYLHSTAMKPTHSRRPVGPTPKRHHPWPTERNEPMTHDATDQIARLAYREAHARWTGDMVAAEDAHAALEAAVVRVDPADWAAVHAAYRAALVDNRHE